MAPWLVCWLVLSAEASGGVTGRVFALVDSISWVPLPGAAVLVEGLGSAGGLGTLTVEDGRFTPPVQVVAPGGALRIVHRGSSAHRLVATAGGEDLFSLWLLVPGLEVTKTMRRQGLVRLACLQPGHQGEEAFVVVRPCWAWALTDSAGTYLVTGVPPGAHLVRAVCPGRGFAADSVEVGPARATPCDLFVVPFSSPEAP